MEDLAKYYHNNVTGTLTLLHAMRAEGIDKLVFSSTCATYGKPLHTPIREDHPRVPINPYGWTKLMIERVMQDYAMAYRLRGVALRYFNAAGAGADVDAETGEDHDSESLLIPLVLQAAAGRRRDITIFGNGNGFSVEEVISTAEQVVGKRIRQRIAPPW